MEKSERYHPEKHPEKTGSIYMGGVPYNYDEMVVCHKNRLSRNENTKTNGQILQNPQARNSVQPARMSIYSGIV